MTIYGIDYGAGAALAIHGPSGPVSKRSLKLPRVNGGRTEAMVFPMIAEALMVGNDEVPAGDIVTESSTIGSSGCEVQDIINLLARIPSRRLYTVSCRAVKNYRKDNDLGWDKGARFVKDGEPAPQEMTIDEQKTVDHCELSPPSRPA